MAHLKKNTGPHGEIMTSIQKLAEQEKLDDGFGL